MKIKWNHCPERNTGKYQAPVAGQIPAFLIKVFRDFSLSSFSKATNISLHIQSSHDKTPPSLSDHESLWTEIFYYTAKHE
jgi:hypothetical protein